MPIMETIATAVQAFNAAKAAVTVAAEAKGSVDTADLKLRLAEAMSALADVKMEAAGMQTRVDELERLASLRRRVKYREPSYWETAKDGSEDGPFCQRCWDADAKLLRLQTTGQFKRLYCRLCRVGYDGPETKALEEEHARKSSGWAEF